MNEKRYSVTIVIHDDKTKEHVEKTFMAKRKIGVWRQVLEEVLKHVNLAQLMTFLGKRNVQGFGSKNILDWIYFGKNDDALTNEKD